jgi:putative ATPase
MEDARKHGSLEVPMHLRNAPTRLMNDLGYGENYRYAHDEEGAIAGGEKYFPDDMSAVKYYHPVPRGLEIRILEKLEDIARRNRDTRSQTVNDDRS